MSGPVNPALVQQIQDLINVWNTHQTQLGAWLGGTMNGGPNEDGRYPLVDALGRETLIPSPAAFSNMVYGPANVAELAKAAAELASDSAEGSATRSNDQRILAEAARGAAVDARNLAQEHRNHAGTHEANARYWAELAQGLGQGSAEDRAVVEQLADQVADDAALAAQDAADAAASAALAATFNPALYDLKSDTIAASRLTGMIDPARIPVLVGQTPVVSTGGIAALTSAQQSGIMPGTLVATTDGRRWVYSGAGSKTVEGSYIEQGDVTPTWSVIADKPSFFPTNIANVAGLQSALDSKAGLTTTNQFTTFQQIVTTNALPLRVTSSDAARGTGIQINHDNAGTVTTRYLGISPAGVLTFGNSLNVMNNSPVLTAATLAASDAVTTSQTNLGKTGNGPLVTLDNATFAAAPTGYSVMTMPLSAATPLDTHGYIFKHGRRDVDGGWGATWITHNSNPSDKPRGFIGATPATTHAPSWAEIWTDSNLAIPIGWLGVIPATGSDLNTYMVPGYAHQNTNAGAAAGANYPTANAGLLEVRKSGTSDFVYQTYTSYAAAGGTGRRTIYHRERYGGVWTEWRQLWDSESFDPANFTAGTINAPTAGIQIGGSGGIVVNSSQGLKVTSTRGLTFVSGGVEKFEIRENSADGNLLLRRHDRSTGAFIENAMVLSPTGAWTLRGTGVNIQADLNLPSGNWIRVSGSTGLYFQDFGGGWRMTDTTWIRAYSDKSIVTAGTVQMGAFTVTSDARLKTDILPITNAAAIIDATNVYEFTKGGKRMYGMIAQEAQKVAPILVSDSADVHPEDGDPILALDQTGYIPLLVEEMKSIRRRLAELEGSSA